MIAECAAKLGDIQEAEAYLLHAIHISPWTDASSRAVHYLGKVYLRQGNVDLAEQVFLELLAQCIGNELERCRVRYNLGQVYEAKRSWDTAAEMYRQAAAGLIALGMYEVAVAAYQNMVWTLLMLKRRHEALEVLELCSGWLRAHVQAPKLVRIQDALMAYALYLSGQFKAAADLSRQLLEHFGPSNWASCLAAILGGWISLEAGRIHDAENALLVAEHFEVQATHETGNFDMTVLVNDLRLRLDERKIRR